MKQFNLLIISLLLSLLTSCVSTKDVRYNQPSETLVINEEGLVPYSQTPYRITRNDMFNLNIVTTPKGDAAQFYSALNTTTSGGSAGSSTPGGQVSMGSTGGTNGNVSIYFNGLKVDTKGDIFVFGIGYIKAEGRTIDEVSQDIQQRVNDNFLEGKSEVRLNLDGITYYIIGDTEAVGISDEKKAYKNTLNLHEVIAMNGGLNRTVDRTIVEIHRKYPEGIKIAKVDLTRQDVMNSPYYWVQNGDEIFFNTRGKNLNGFGKDPVQTVTTGVSVLTTLLSLVLIFTRL